MCLRIAGRRTFAQYSPLDIVVALIVGSNLSRVMTGKAAFWPALSATMVLVLLRRVITFATLHWGVLSTPTKARPVTVVRDGQIDEGALHRAGLSREDLYEALRMEQAKGPEDAALVTMEAGGKVSVVHRRQP